MERTKEKEKPEGTAANGTAAVPPLEVLPPEEEGLEVELRAQRSHAVELAGMKPEQAKAWLETLAAVIETCRSVAIRGTNPTDWTLFKDREGHEVAVLRASGAARIRQWLGISVYNHRGSPDGTTNGEPRVSSRVLDNNQPITVVELYADARCARTGEEHRAIPFAVRSDDQFIGRKGSDEKPRLEDMKSACRTGLDKKATALLSGLLKIPVDELATYGVDAAKCYRGSGYGRSEERAATAVAEPGVKEKREELRAALVKAVGGDVQAIPALVLALTKTDKFKGFDSVDRLTQGWQVDNALKRLREHPVHGREPGDEPPEEGNLPL